LETFLEGEIMATALRKYKSLWSSTSNSFGTGTGETITPASVTGLPSGEITLTFDRQVEGKIERITGTISGGNFVISARGVDGTTEQAHTSPTVEMVWNAADWNDAIDTILSQHTASGTHTAITASTINGNTVATGTDAVALVAASQTLTNKTLTTPIIAKFSGASKFPQVHGEYDNGNSGTAKEIDWANGDRQKVTITGDACAFTFANATAGQTLTLRVVVDATGHTAWTWPTLKWPGGSVGTPGITANKINLYIFYFDGTNYLAQLAADFS
jgi:hypothetical protein